MNYVILLIKNGISNLQWQFSNAPIKINRLSKNLWGFKSNTSFLNYR